jgi:hypothetical protein
MGKKWIMLLVIASVVVFTTAVYAFDKMVIVLDPNNQGAITCYRVANFSLPSVNLSVPCDDYPTRPHPPGPPGTPGHRDLRGPQNNQELNIKDQNHPNYNAFADHPVRLGPVGGSIVWSNPCVTYRIGGQSYTVCN